MPPELKANYAAESASQIEVDADEVRKLGVKPVLGNYLDDHKGVARHATDRVAKDLMQLVAGRAISSVSL